MSEALLRIKGVHAGYGDVPVLWGVDLEVGAGEIVCLVGPSGCGKTTLMPPSALVPRSAARSAAPARSFRPRTRQVLAAASRTPRRPASLRGDDLRDNLLMGAYLRRAARRLVEPTSRACTRCPVLRERPTRTRPPCRAASSRCAPSPAG